MKIEKRSKSFRIQKQIYGKRYSFTFDHKPTQKEIQQACSEITQRNNGKITFQNAAESYINARSNTISQSTEREYIGTLNRLSERFRAMQIDDIGTIDVQREINNLAKDKSPKTVRNYHGFISAVLGEFRPQLILTTKLPQKEKQSVYIPSSADIKQLIEYAKDTQYEVPILLGCASMRRSEICALTMDDIDIENRIIHITKGMVMDKNKEWVIKPPKTTESIRDIPLPDQVLDAILRNGLYTGHPNSISDWMDKAEKKLGLQHFSLHRCRHYFASAAHESGIPDADIQKAGGWRTNYVLNSTYKHSLKQDNSAASNAVFNTLFN